MNVASLNSNLWQSASASRDAISLPDALKAPRPDSDATEANGELRQAFQSFVGETLFGQMLKAARQTQNKPAYFHGGRAEEIFQQQLDQVLAEKIARSDGAQYSNALFELFTLKRT
ncbi:MAG: rod-binding protein [Thermoguttaceae bacterium]